ncbi:MAG: CrcB family protein, partial [Synechococcaceae cyanobacterium]|nr:CrcB family protein [Synechococcaceae cyanobacterium]
WLRFRVVDHLEPMLPRKHWGTFGVNLIACFSLGLLVGLQSHCGAGAARTLLLLGTGFLGSFSTFSTLMAELLVTLRQGQVLEALVLAGGSLLGGLGAMATGLHLGG